MLVRWNYLLLCGFVLSVASTASAGWPFFSDSDVARGTPEFYEARANDPVGARQKYAYGRVWPPQARPCGPEQTCMHKYYAAHYWPHPYNCADRAAVRMMAQAQTDNGWQAATTLYDYHFDPKSNELNSAGREHLRWLLTHAPVQYRQPYVSSTFAADLNNVRLASVEQEVVHVMGPGQVPAPLLRVADPLGRPAIEVHNILQQAEAARNLPVIPFTAATGEGSSN